MRGSGTGPNAGSPKKYAARSAKSAKNSRLRAEYDRSCRSHDGTPYSASRRSGCRNSASSARGSRGGGVWSGSDSAAAVSGEAALAGAGLALRPEC